MKKFSLPMLELYKLGCIDLSKLGLLNKSGWGWGSPGVDVTCTLYNSLSDVGTYTPCYAPCCKAKFWLRKFVSKSILLKYPETGALSFPGLKLFDKR